MGIVYACIQVNNIIFPCYSGAKIEFRDKDNFTPLLIAASNGHSATIGELLKQGANLRAVDKHEKSAVFWAAQENEVQALTVSFNQ